MEQLNIILQAQAKNNSMMSMLLMLGMVVVLYFFMIRPQMKKAKQQKEFASGIQTGANIVTISGIHGKILKENDDNTLQVEIARNMQVKMERSAISMEMTAGLNKEEKA